MRASSRCRDTPSRAWAERPCTSAAIASPRAAPGGAALVGRLIVNPDDAVCHEFGEEGVEIGEVPGQAWHWVDPVAGAAKVAQMLRPGGRLAVFWNAAQPPLDLAEAFAAVYREVMPDSLAAREWTRPAVDWYLMLCTKAFDGIRHAGAFGDPEAVAIRLGAVLHLRRMARPGAHFR